MVSKALEAATADIAVKAAALIPPTRDGRDGKRGEPGEDGRDGKDGADGFGIDDIDLELKDGRTVVVVLRSGSGRERRKEVTLAGMPQDRGVFKAGEPYEAGDCVIYGSAYWCAKQATQEPPKGDGNHWRLVLKGNR